MFSILHSPHLSILFGTFMTLWIGSLNLSMYWYILWGHGLGHCKMLRIPGLHLRDQQPLTLPGAARTCFQAATGHRRHNLVPHWRLLLTPLIKNTPRLLFLLCFIDQHPQSKQRLPLGVNQITLIHKKWNRNTVDPERQWFERCWSTFVTLLQQSTTRYKDTNYASQLYPLLVRLLVHRILLVVTFWGTQKLHPDFQLCGASTPQPLLCSRICCPR